MRILVTGAKGFVGKNLCAQLNNIKDGKARCYGDLTIEEVFEYDLDSTPEQLDTWCKECDFVFNLAGVNRPKDNHEFMKGNFGFASTLLDTLKAHKNTCPVMLPGYTHNIINLSDTEDLVTVMYCNEIFDPNRPDTYFDKVEK